MKTYCIFLDAAGTILKTIAYYKGDLTSDFEGDKKLLIFSFLRIMSTSGGVLAYGDLFQFTNEEEYGIPRDRIVGFAELSNTHSLAFMDYIKKTTDFAKAREIPYFENQSLFEPKN